MVCLMIIVNIITVNHAEMINPDSGVSHKGAEFPVSSAAAYPGMPRTGLRHRAAAQEDCISEISGT